MIGGECMQIKNIIYNDKYDFHEYEPPVLTDDEQILYNELIKQNNNEILLHILHTLQTMDISILNHIIR